SAIPPTSRPANAADIAFENGDTSSTQGCQNATLATAPPRPATTAATNPRHSGQRELRRSSRHSAGTTNTATRIAAIMANDFVQASGPKGLGSRPVRKKPGRKLMIVVVPPLITAGATSYAASMITSARLRVSDGNGSPSAPTPLP